jgi:hypothetical protein
MKKHRCTKRVPVKVVRDFTVRLGKKKATDDDFCAECEKEVGRNIDDWWCPTCGLAFCHLCRPDRSLDHVNDCCA